MIYDFFTMNRTRSLQNDQNHRKTGKIRLNMKKIRQSAQNRVCIVYPSIKHVGSAENTIPHLVRPTDIRDIRPTKKQSLKYYSCNQLEL